VRKDLRMSMILNVDEEYDTVYGYAFPQQTGMQMSYG
jgi:hypothetical protein